MPRCEDRPAWRRLEALAAHRRQGFDLRMAFQADASRADRLAIGGPHVFVDLSRQWLDDEVDAALLDLAREAGVCQQRDALFAGDMVNLSERRAALHWVWREGALHPAAASDGAAAADARTGVLAAARARVADTRGAMLQWAERVRADEAIRDVLHIGIGGSDLGPRLVIQALAGRSPKRLHFVANVDGHELDAALHLLEPARTLVLVASKSFGTQETLRNAATVRDWLRRGGVAPERHLVALTAAPGRARDFGAGQCFAFDDTVGGRCSLWSPVGAVIAIALGAQGFLALLGGAEAMDVHFRAAPPASNLPLRLGLLDVWCRSLLRWPSRCVVPYDSRLRLWPAYLQQLEMESNGKAVDGQGRALAVATAPIVWGEAGTNGQHAFFQWLHQGVDVTPVEFIAVRHPDHALPGHHELLLSSAVAQAQALMWGRGHPDPQQVLPGNRPSTFMVLQRLDAASLGALIALHEHRVFTAAAVWGINPFDQWGVELGKSVAQALLPVLRREALQTGGVGGPDAAAIALLDRLRP